MENEENIRQNVQAFLQRLRTIPHAASIEPAEANKLAFLFLRARKFDVSRAIELYKAYRHMRYSQQLEHIDPLDEGVRRELLSEKFTVLPHSADPSEPTVLLFSVRRHWPPNSTDRDVLKGILYQLDAALLDERTQIQGITVIYDMTDAKYSNFDADLSLKLLNLLAGCYPARLRNVFIISAPFWFRPPYHISRLFVRDKIRERILAIEKSQLQRYLSVKTIPISLGGCLHHRHLDWLRICLERMHCTPPADYFSQPAFNLANGGPYFYSSSSSSALTPQQHRRRRRSYCPDGDDDGAAARTVSAPIRSPSFRSAGGGNRSWRLGSGGSGSSTISWLPSQRSFSVIRRPTVAAAGGSEFSAKRSAAAARLFDIPLANHHSDAASTPPAPSQRNNNAPPSLAGGESGLTDGNLATDPKSPYRLPVADFLARYRAMASSRQLEKEFDMAFKDTPICGTINRFQSRSNAPKNRYVDVPCLDQSAVLLPQNGYIHANFVHSYSRKNAYILTQGPLDSTIADFWQMVWSSGASVVVMLTKTVENMRVKCSQYWPEASSSKRASKVLHCGPFTVTNNKETLEADGLYRHSRLSLSKPTECGGAAAGGSCSSMYLAKSEGGDTNIDGVDGLCSPRQVDHFLFLGWPDYDVPSSAVGFLTFLDVVNQHVARLHSKNRDSIPPLIVHCSAGIGRTGTFTSIDIALEQAKEERVVDIRGIVARMRCQRACTVQTAKQYAFIHQAVFTRLASDS